MYIEPLHQFLMYIELSKFYATFSTRVTLLIENDQSLRQLPADYILIIVLYNLRRALNMT